MKFYKKYIKIETKGAFRTAYYEDCKNESIYCGTYTKSYSTEEIKKDVLKELRQRFA